MNTTNLSSTLRLADTQIQQYHDQGFFVLENVIPAEHLEILRGECQAGIDRLDAEMDRLGTNVNGINHKGKRYFISGFQQSERLPEFLFSDLTAEICRATLGPQAYLFHEQYVVKCAEVGMKFAWHQDSGYVGFAHRPYLSLWCALDDVNEENGTVYMLPYDRAETRDRVEHQRESGTNDLVGYFGEDPGVPVNVPAGSIAVFSSTCFHRSGMNTTQKMRRIYLAQYSAEPILRPDNGKLQGVAEPFLKDGERVDAGASAL